MLPLITIDDLCFQTPDGRTLFEDLNLACGAERIGLVGANGCGKTTLLRLILGELSPSAGAVRVRGRIGALRQALAPPAGATVADLLGVADGLARLARIEQGSATDADLEAADWGLTPVMNAALAEVGLAGLDPWRPADALSGGETTRTALAGLLIARPDMILLDEPTNNLDQAARANVRGILERWEGGALVVSHDRALLRGMAHIVELGALGARLFGGGYDLYKARRDEAATAAQRDLDVASSEARRVEREIQMTRERQDRRDGRGLRVRARGDQPGSVLDARAARAEKTRGGQGRLAERRRAEAQAALNQARSRVEQARRLAFALPSSELAAGKLVLAFEDVDFAWPATQPLLRGVSFRLAGPQRLAVRGANGSGKTTLVRLATGDLTPTSGRIIRGVAPILLDQRAAVLSDDLSLLENFRRLNPEADDNHARAALARFLFRNSAALKTVGDLSGGERLRAALACVLMTTGSPRLIILDEPTNHIDLESIRAVEMVLAAFEGALLVVSHDEDFLGAVGVDASLTLGPG